MSRPLGSSEWRPPANVQPWVLQLARAVLVDDGTGYPRVAAGCSRGVGVDGGSMLAESDECHAMRLAIDEMLATRGDSGRELLSIIVRSPCDGPDVYGINWLGERVDELLGER